MFGQAIITVPAKRALQAELAFRQSSIDTFDTSQLSQVTTGGSCPAGDDFAAVEVQQGLLQLCKPHSLQDWQQLPWWAQLAMLVLREASTECSSRC